MFSDQFHENEQKVFIKISKIIDLFSTNKKLANIYSGELELTNLCWRHRDWEQICVFRVNYNKVT